MASSGRRRPRRALAHDTRVLLLALASGLPARVVAIALLWTGDHAPKVRWTLGTLMTGVWLAFAFAARERVVRPIQTLSNMLAALREGDFSIRGRSTSRNEPLGLAFWEANTLSETLRQQRLGALEASALLRRVMEEIDTAVFAFDGARRLRLVNRAGEKLLGRPLEHLLGRPAGALGLDDALGEGGDAGVEPTQVTDLKFAGGAGRFVVRRSGFRQAGMPHRLLVLSDVSRTLREEERQAWQRLVRVLSHEINNSLTPIKSIAGSLSSMLARSPRPPGLEQDLATGLQVVSARAESLTRFMGAYARLARLPRPRLAAVDVERWVRHVAGLETRVAVAVDAGPAAVVVADGDQLDQLLINLVRNAADAVLETDVSVAQPAPATSAPVRLGWAVRDGHVQVWVEDEGPGLSDTDNLFVPFFTTKPAGSGVGLALSRQIAEAHGGSLVLANRTDTRGCIARLRLPLVPGTEPA